VKKLWSVKTHKQVVGKFLLLCALLLGYFGYLAYEYGFATGGMTALLTWSFFVLCTPIADAGFLLDFPLRLLFGVRMIVSEIAVWVIAILMNAGAVAFYPEAYATTVPTQLLYEIILTPYPYWAIIVLSGMGSFLSIRFGDELMDVLHHHERDFFHSHQFKHELIVMAFFFMGLVGYYKLVEALGMDVL